MKILKTFALIAVAALALTSCIHKGDLHCDPVPDIAFEYTCDGLTLTFKSITPGTSNITWEIVGQNATGQGETFSYAFPQPGNYWIKMTGTYAGQEQTFAGKILVAKPSNVKLHDDSFDDWDSVTDEDFQFTAALNTDLYPEDQYTNRCYGKFDYDANYIYFFFALNADLPKAGPGQAILNLRLDADDLTGTGMSNKKLGCDWYLEGAIWGNEGWYSQYDCSTGDTVESDMQIEIGTCKQVGDMMYMEIGYSRKDYKINGSSIGVFMKFYHEDWDNAIFIYSYEGKETFHLALDKMK